MGVIAVHSVALTIYYLAGIQDTSPRTRTTFTTVWLFVTAIVVAVLLKRVRQVRRSRSGPRLR